ncbi:MAG: methyltransferase domain-containing protein [Deltaproteobacteria bacterium]|nr:methyltransferase domain-containing protein [Deltaproteobacteria bacterium]
MKPGTGATRPAAARVASRTFALVLVSATVIAAATRSAPSRGWLGVTLREDRAHAISAARIDTVLPESPAAAAGFESGDLVRRAGDRTIHAARELTETVRRTLPGTTLVLRVERAGVPCDVTVTIGARPPDLYRLLELDRDAWQEPARVLALLGVDAGAAVADVGAGGGYFTARLAAAVGTTGRVIAVDIDADALEQLTTRFADARNVVVQRGLPTDPRLDPNTLDAVLMVDTFHELRAADMTLAAIRRALRADGRLVIVDHPAAEYVAGTHAIPEARVVAAAEAAGFHRRERVDLPRQFVVVFE